MTRILNLVDSFDLLSKYKIPVVRGDLAKTSKAAVSLAKTIGFPVVLKLVSSISHKTEAKGIAVNLDSKEEVVKAFDEIIASAKKKKAKVDGILVQPMVEGVEVIVGGKQDPQFGPIVVVGLGGVFVELYKDASLRLAPVTEKDAKEMLDEVTGFALLRGFRGAKKANEKKLIDVILKVSDLMISEPVQELDINPLFVGKESVAVDARVVLE